MDPETDTDRQPHVAKARRGRYGYPHHPPPVHNYLCTTTTKTHPQEERGGLGWFEKNARLPLVPPRDLNREEASVASPALSRASSHTNAPFGSPGLRRRPRAPWARPREGREQAKAPKATPWTFLCSLRARPQTASQIARRKGLSSRALLSPSSSIFPTSR